MHRDMTRLPCRKGGKVRKRLRQDNAGAEKCKADPGFEFPDRPWQPPGPGGRIGTRIKKTGIHSIRRSRKNTSGPGQDGRKPAGMRPESRLCSPSKKGAACQKTNGRVRRSERGRR